MALWRPVGLQARMPFPNSRACCWSAVTACSAPDAYGIEPHLLSISIGGHEVEVGGKLGGLEGHHTIRSHACTHGKGGMHVPVGREQAMLKASSTGRRRKV